MERTEQMYTIQKQMDFGKIKVRVRKQSFQSLTLTEILAIGLDVNRKNTMGLTLNLTHSGTSPLLLTCTNLVSLQPFPLVSSSRWLKKHGELAFSSEELSIWRAFSTRSYYLFLFNDVLIVTKKKRSVELKDMM